MKDLVEYIVKQLVSIPDAVVVEEQVDGTQIQLYLTVDPSDMGLVIGKSGQTIKAIRKLLTVKAMADEVRVNLTLNEQNRPAGDETSDESETPEESSATTEPEVTDESAPSESESDEPKAVETDNVPDHESEKNNDA